MTAGSRTYEGRAVPLKGESEIVQETLGTDILTITGAASQTGDFLVCRNSSATEKAYVTKDGKIYGAGIIQSATFLQTLDNGTTAPDTSAITADGGLMVAKVSGTIRLYLRDNGTVRYINTDG